MLNKIKIKLENVGYISYLRNIANVDCLFSYIENNLNSVFFIKMNSKKFKIEYTVGQIPVEKEFSTIDELLNFVKEVFPIE